MRRRPLHHQARDEAIRRYSQMERPWTDDHRRRPVLAHPPEPVMVLSLEVLAQIIRHIGAAHAEQGGALGGLSRRGVVDHFYFDHSSQTSGATYTPDKDTVNRVFKEQWNPAGINLRGFVHSHPGSHGVPSPGDLQYAARILDYIEELPQLLLPIVNTVPDTGAFSLRPYAATRGAGRARCHVIQLQVRARPGRAMPELPGELELDPALLGQRLDRLVLKVRRPVIQVPRAVEPSPRPTQPPASPRRAREVPAIFQRVQQAYDLDLMARSRVIAVGAGGAASYLEDLARAGLGQVVLIDPDTVSETNIATQQVYLRDVGRPKVVCIAQRLRQINPRIRVQGLKRYLDELDDIQFMALVRRPIEGRPPSRLVLCGLTDSFAAQARVNRLALNLGLPSMSAQVYQEGRGLELVYTHPEVTPACARCALGRRYRMYQQGYENDVTSNGTPIYATTRLNALKHMVTLALLHHGSDHPALGGLLQRMGNRNLVQVRLDPDVGQTLGLPVFDRVLGGGDSERLLCDETVWLPQEPERPDTGYEACRDCGGTGDLRSAFGTIEDTRDLQL